MKDIIFISEIQDPDKLGSSTQILTKNILDGFFLNNCNTTFIAIIDSDCNPTNITKYYSNSVSNIIILKSQLELRLIGGKFKKLLKLLSFFFFNKKYGDELKILKNIASNTVIISHSPSIESIFISRLLQEKNKNLRYIQYWSDPIALSGIYPENLNYKRYIYYLIEKKLLGYSDDIVYATKTLLHFQKKLYPSLAYKMRYVDISYIKKEQVIDQNTSKRKVEIIYAGSYKSHIRNIKPFYEASLKFKDAHFLICGDSDIFLNSTKNVEVIQKRFSQNEILAIEERASILVAILNSSCIQIPGKVFYHTNKNIALLIILDGGYQDDIKSYLSDFNRFEFCHNDPVSITNAINKIIATNFLVNFSKIDMLSPETVTQKILDKNQ